LEKRDSDYKLITCPIQRTEIKKVIFDLDEEIKYVKNLRGKLKIVIILTVHLEFWNWLFGSIRPGPIRDRGSDRTVAKPVPVSCPTTVMSNDGSVLSSPKIGPCRPIPCGSMNRIGPSRGPDQFFIIFGIFIFFWVLFDF
jgi:hypothetical protein